MVHILHTVFGVIGNACGLFLFLAPTITFKKILRKRSIEDFSGVPYTMALLNCLLYTWYGLPFVSPNNILVSIINGTGAVLESIYVLIFLILAPKKEKAKVFGILVLVLTTFAAVVLVSMLALHGKTRKLFVGLIATIFSIAMYAAPLSVMVPNGFGCVLGAMQLMLYAIYHKNKGDNNKGVANGSLEMGIEQSHQQKHATNDRQLDGQL
ncbi:bidirectional sugar transporter SWEET1 isoform X1 [Coffea arabica]|uniref:Bidirectional sugar transporter SWEET1 isoform X1 n=1 Tax=Coffea arabica TaxID=13443 RepID=A0ABM4VWV1_COFAR